MDGGGGGGGGGLGVGEGVILVGEGEGSEEGLNLGLLWRWLRGWLVEEEARMTSKSFITGQPFFLLEERFLVGFIGGEKWRRLDIFFSSRRLDIWI